MHSRKRKTKEQFIKEAQETHKNKEGFKYDYSKVEYKNQNTKVCIICPKHGEFWQTPRVHLMGRGCPECGKEKCKAVSRKGNPNMCKKHRKWDTESLIDECKKIYGENAYDYSKVKYNGRKSRVTLICPKHGEFTLPFGSIVYKHTGCKQCHNEYLRSLFQLGKDEFIRKSQEIHGKDTYDYSKVVYKNNNIKVCVICHEKDVNGDEHGEFLVTPANHLKNRGCPKCRAETWSYENKLFKIISEVFGADEVIRQYRHKRLGRLSLDFYLPKYHLAVEHQGSQHFKPMKRFGGEAKFQILRQNDKIKYQICQNEGIKLLYFAFEKYTVPSDYFDKVYTDIIEFKNILKEIYEQSNWN